MDTKNTLGLASISFIWALSCNTLADGTTYLEEGREASVIHIEVVTETVSEICIKVDDNPVIHCYIKE